jgi:hypothetical protein
MELAQKYIDRFWSRVDISGGENACWEWQGGRTIEGYGGYNTPLTSGAHRHAYYFAYRELPGGLLVCHHCDNPPCCNPKHLFLGTHLDNMRDKARKNRRRVVREMTPERQTRKLYHDIIAQMPSTTIPHLVDKIGIEAALEIVRKILLNNKSIQVSITTDVEAGTIVVHKELK